MQITEEIVRETALICLKARRHARYLCAVIQLMDHQQEQVHAHGDN